MDYHLLYGGQLDRSVVTVREATEKEASSLSPSTSDSVLLYRSYIESGLQIPLTPLVRGILSWFDIAPCQVNANFYQVISLAAKAIPSLSPDLVLTPELFVNCYKLAFCRRSFTGVPLGLFVIWRYHDVALPGWRLPRSEERWMRNPFVVTGRWQGLDKGPHITSLPNPYVDLLKPPPPLCRQDAVAFDLLRQGRIAAFEKVLETPGHRGGNNSRNVASTMTKRTEEDCELSSSCHRAFFKRRKLSLSSSEIEEGCKFNSSCHQTFFERRELCHSFSETREDCKLNSSCHGTFFERRESSLSSSETNEDCRLNSLYHETFFERRILGMSSFDNEPTSRAPTITTVEPGIHMSSSECVIAQDERKEKGIEFKEKSRPAPNIIPMYATSAPECPSPTLNTQTNDPTPMSVPLEKSPPSLNDRTTIPSSEGSVNCPEDKPAQEPHFDSSKTHPPNCPTELLGSRFGPRAATYISANIPVKRSGTPVVQANSIFKSPAAATKDMGKYALPEDVELEGPDIDELTSTDAIVTRAMTLFGIWVKHLGEIQKSACSDEELREEKEQLQAKVERLKKQFSKLKTKTETNASEVRRHEDQQNADIGTVKRELEETRTKVSSLTAASASLNAEKNELSRLLKHYKAEIAVKSSVIGELERFKVENEELKSEVEGLRKECYELKTQMGSDACEIQQLEHELNAERVKSGLGEIRNLVFSQMATIADLRAVKEELSRLLNQSKDEIDAKSSIVKELQRIMEENEEFKSEVEGQARECSELKVQTESAESEVRRLKDAMNMERGKFERELGETRIKVFSQAAAIVDLHAEKDELSRLLKQSRHEIDAKNSVVQELQGLKEENEELKSEVEGLTWQCSELKVQADSAESEIRWSEDQMNIERSRVQRELSETRNTLTSQATAIIELNSEKDVLSRLLDQSRDVISAKSTIINELQSSITKLEGKVACSMQREGIIKILRDSAFLAEELADAEVKRSREVGYNDGFMDGRRTGWREFVEMQKRQPSLPESSI